MSKGPALVIEFPAFGNPIPHGPSSELGLKMGTDGRMLERIIRRHAEHI
jgi:hypothetical protein